MYAYALPGDVAIRLLCLIEKFGVFRCRIRLLLDTVSSPIINLGLHDWLMDAFAHGRANQDGYRPCVR